MPKAVWNGTVLAESDDTLEVEGNQYFPADSLNREFFQSSDHTTFCGWKGTANYYSLEVAGERNENAAWFYADPKPDAAHVKDRVAFWKGVEVVD